MSESYINIVKLCVGIASVSELANNQQKTLKSFKSMKEKTNIYHTTRMWPKKKKQLVSGGSLYWVLKGNILARQSILDLEVAEGTDGIGRCKIILDNNIYRTHPQPKSPFQGWRYLLPENSPKDIELFSPMEEELPESMQIALSHLGVI